MREDENKKERIEGWEKIEFITQKKKEKKPDREQTLQEIIDEIHNNL